jgi:hypothetical protein
MSNYHFTRYSLLKSISKSMNADLKRLSVVKIRYGDGALYVVCMVVPVYVLYVVAWSMLFATRSGWLLRMQMSAEARYWSPPEARLFPYPGFGNQRRFSSDEIPR